MPKQNLEERVARLEEQVAELLADRGNRKKDWRRTIGMFTDNPVMKEIQEEALRYRERDREKTRGDNS